MYELFGVSMLTEPIFKPSYDEWQHWAQVVVDRLTTCVHIYSKPPFEDVFMPEKERQDKNAKTLDLLRRIYVLLEETDTPSDSLTNVAHHDERVIAGLAVMMKETLDHLPQLSRDMQKFLKSHWFDKYNGRLASELFHGPMGRDGEGIGSGYVEHGRLPLSLNDLLERECVGDIRQPRRELHRSGEGRGFLPGDITPQRRDEQGELRRRWADKNSQFLRSAGRVE